MAKILFPTDFSSAAENAFLNALSLAKKINAELILLHVYELPELGRALKTTTREVYEMMEMESFEAFKEEVKKLREIASLNGYSDISFSHEMMEGDSIYRINQVAEKYKVDYIVMGTKGATGLKEIFLGSVASGVIDSAAVDVICIPESTNHKTTLNKVAYLTNYQKEEQTGFKKIGDFAKMFNAEVLCVHFDGDDSCEKGEEMEAWKSKVDRPDVKLSYHVLKGNDFEKELIRFNQENNIDLIAVQPRKKNIFARLFSKSVSKSIAHHLNVPLYTFPKI